MDSFFLISVGTLIPIMHNLVKMVYCLQDMTVAQLEAFTDVQAVSVTQEQKDAMTTAQKGVLDAATSGGQDPEPEVTVAPSPPPRSIGKTQLLLFFY